MKKYLLILLVTFACMPLAVNADNEHGKNERVAWFTKMREYKHDFLIKKLGLEDQQREQFFALYDKMNDEIHAVERQTRNMERAVCKKGDAATDLEYEKAAEACYELAGKRNAIEMKYFKEFKKVLTPKQMFLLQKAERDFTRQLMEHRGKKK
ncbi:MAG: Spy/CpxP family protein refolding chaperone [Muribaculaceae bacterium]|nr:Spy/CpxP family protein refolding chaperone [Muribaculaceae bacterium]